MGRETLTKTKIKGQVCRLLKKLVHISGIACLGASSFIVATQLFFLNLPPHEILLVEPYFWIRTIELPIFIYGFIYWLHIIKTQRTLI